MWDFVSSIGEKIFTEAGILAFVLFWWSIYLVADNRSLRKELKTGNASHADEVRGLNNKIYDMGIKQISTNIETNNVLDKIGDTLTGAFSKLGKRKKPDEHNGTS